MRTLLAVLAGVAIGCAATLGAATLAGGWYEYHLHERGDPLPTEMVNRHGWEPIIVEETTSSAVWVYRRPRIRIR